MLDKENMDPIIYEKRKKEAIEIREKKRKSAVFMFFASLFEIIETLIIVILLFLLTMFLCFKVFKLNENQELQQMLLPALMFFVFIGGMILGFIVYKKVVRWAIKKFKLEDKLSEEVLYHYRSKEENEKIRRENLHK